MNVVVQATNLEVTSELREFVEEKISDALRPFGRMADDPAMKIMVELEADTGHHRKSEHAYRAEFNVGVRGRLFRAESTADDIHRAITDAKHILTKELRRWKTKLIDDARNGARSATALTAEELGFMPDETPDEREGIR